MRRKKTIALGAALLVAAGSLGAAFATVGHDDPVDLSATRPSTTSTSTTAPADDADHADHGAAPRDADAPAAADARSSAGIDVPAGDHRQGEAGATGDTGVVVPTVPVHEVLPGAGGPPPAGTADPIGELRDDWPVPAGLVAPVLPQAGGGTVGGFGGPGGLGLAPGCSYQCISSGLAYPRGFGAKLVVETTVPVTLHMTAIADLDGDTSYETTHQMTTPSGFTSGYWALDHLVPGATYHVMAVATDEDGSSSYAWGEFTTLSQRDIFVELGDLQITGGPGGITSTTASLGLDGATLDVTPGQQGILQLSDLPRYVDVDVLVKRKWEDTYLGADVCGAWAGPGGTASGIDSGACIVWSSDSMPDVDLDKHPGGGATTWTQTGVPLVLHAVDDGPAFAFTLPIVLHVAYS